MYNIILRCVCATIVAVEKQEVLDIICVFLYSCLSYLAYKSHLFCVVLYCHPWPVWIYHIFFTISHKWHDSQKTFIEHKMSVLIFSTTFVQKFSF